MFFIIGSVTAKEKKLSCHIAYHNDNVFVANIFSYQQRVTVIVTPKSKKFVCSIRMFAII